MTSISLFGFEKWVRASQVPMKKNSPQFIQIKVDLAESERVSSTTTNLKSVSYIRKKTFIFLFIFIQRSKLKMNPLFSSLFSNNNKIAE